MEDLLENLIIMIGKILPGIKQLVKIMKNIIFILIKGVGIIFV